jgi:hypothetical protein
MSLPDVSSASARLRFRDPYGEAIAPDPVVVDAYDARSKVFAVISVDPFKVAEVRVLYTA